MELLGVWEPVPPLGRMCVDLLSRTGIWSKKRKTLDWLDAHIGTDLLNAVLEARQLQRASQLPFFGTIAESAIFRKTVPTPDHIAALQGFAHLSRLELSAPNSLRGTGLEPLVGLAVSLVDLDLQGCTALGALADTGFLCQLTGLKHLSLASTAVGSEATIAPLSLLPLTSLDLCGTRLGDTGCERLASLTSLRVLRISNNRITSQASSRLVLHTRPGVDPLGAVLVGVGGCAEGIGLPHGARGSLDRDIGTTAPWAIAPCNGHPRASAVGLEHTMPGIAPSFPPPKGELVASGCDAGPPLPQVRSRGRVGRGTLSRGCRGAARRDRTRCRARVPRWAAARAAFTSSTSPPDAPLPSLAVISGCCLSGEVVWDLLGALLSRAAGTLTRLEAAHVRAPAGRPLPLSLCPALRHLDLQGLAEEGPLLGMLPALTALTQLALSSSPRLGGAELARAVSSLLRLEELQLAGCCRLDDGALPALLRLSRLTRLDLGGTGLTGTGMGRGGELGWRSLPRLVALVLPGGFQEGSLWGLSDLPALRELAAGALHLSDKGLRRISRATALRSLKVSASDASVEAVLQLAAALQGLRELAVTGVWTSLGNEARVAGEIARWAAPQVAQAEPLEKCPPVVRGRSLPYLQRLVFNGLQLSFPWTPATARAWPPLTPAEERELDERIRYSHQELVDCSHLDLAYLSRTPEGRDPGDPTALAEMATEEFRRGLAIREMEHTPLARDMERVRGEIAAALPEVMLRPAIG